MGEEGSLSPQERQSQALDISVRRPVSQLPQTEGARGEAWGVQQLGKADRLSWVYQAFRILSINQYGADAMKWSASCPLYRARK